MNARIYLRLVLLLAFLVFPCGFYAASTVVQLPLIVLLLLAFYLLRGTRALVSQLKLFLPLASMILLLHLVAGALHHQPLQGLYHGCTISLLLANSFLFLALLLSSLKIADILGLPLSDTLRKSVLLMRILLLRAERILPEMESALALYPRPSGEGRLKARFQRALQLILALLPLCA